MPGRRWVLIAAFMLAGCLTSGQQEAIRVQREINRAMAASDACLAPLRERPAYQALYRRLAIEPTIPPPEPTPAQMADPGLADREAVRVMVALHADLAACRGPMIESIARIAPELAETAVDVWLRGDRLVLMLMRREITWGETNRRIGALQEDYFRHLAAVIAETRRRIDATQPGSAIAAEAPPMPLPTSVVRFPAELAEIHRQMQAELARMPG
jgi:hypothetical protein